MVNPLGRGILELSRHRIARYLQGWRRLPRSSISIVRMLLTSCQPTGHLWPWVSLFKIVLLNRVIVRIMKEKPVWCMIQHGWRLCRKSSTRKRILWMREPYRQRQALPATSYPISSKGNGRATKSFRRRSSWGNLNWETILRAQVLQIALIRSIKQIYWHQSTYRVSNPLEISNRSCLRGTSWVQLTFANNPFKLTLIMEARVVRNYSPSSHHVPHQKRRLDRWKPSHIWYSGMAKEASHVCSKTI